MTWFGLDPVEEYRRCDLPADDLGWPCAAVEKIGEVRPAL
jgi:hypothetical protein